LSTGGGRKAKMECVPRGTPVRYMAPGPVQPCGGGHNGLARAKSGREPQKVLKSPIDLDASSD